MKVFSRRMREAEASMVLYGVGDSAQGLRVDYCWSNSQSVSSGLWLGKDQNRIVGAQRPSNQSARKRGLTERSLERDAEDAADLFYQIRLPFALATKADVDVVVAVLRSAPQILSFSSHGQRAI